MTAKKKRKSNLPMLGVAVVVVAAGLYGVGPGKWFEQEAEAAVNGAEVRRGPLTISVLQRGNLSSKNSVKMRSQIEGRATILYLIAEGTMVEAGELLAELDTSELEDRKVGQEIAVENSNAALTKAEQQREIQKSQNDSDIAKAKQELEFAKMDLEKYRDEEGEWTNQEKQAQEDILLAEQQLAQAKDRLDWSQRLYDDGFLTRTKLEEDNLSHESAKIRVEQSKRQRDLLIKFDHNKELKRLIAAVAEADRELVRVELQAAARLVDFDAEVSTSTSKLSLEEEKLNKWTKQIEAAKMIAPEAGMVVYGRTEGGRMGGGGDPIQEGTEVRERQEIIQIPKAGGMIVEASLHESVLKKVQVGQDCRIRVDSIPGQEFYGVVDSVAVLPDKASWWANPDQRLYKTEILIENGNAEMRPGGSCSVEIIVTRLEDAIYAPAQSILFHRGQAIAFVDENGSVEERSVTVGQSSEKWVEVVSGLAEGEVVLLAPPPGFMPEGAPENEGGAGEGGPSGETRRPGAQGGTPAGKGGMPLGDSGGTKREGRSGAERGAGGEHRTGAGAGAGNQGGREGGGGFQVTDEMRKRWESMSEEDRKKMMEGMRNGGTGGSGSPGRGGRPGSPDNGDN